MTQAETILEKLGFNKLEPNRNIPNLTMQYNRNYTVITVLLRPEDAFIALDGKSENVHDCLSLIIRVRDELAKSDK